MITMTKSFKVWCLKYYKEIYHLLMFGHVEELSEEMYLEYLEWCMTDEGRECLRND